MKTTAATERRERLIPNGQPRYLKIYDKPDTLDRYTAVFTGRYKGRPVLKWEYLVMSEKPFHPMGIGSHGETECRPGAYLGKRISFDELPEDCKKAVMQDYKDLWNI